MGVAGVRCAISAGAAANLGVVRALCQPTRGNRRSERKGHASLTTQLRHQAEASHHSHIESTTHTSRGALRFDTQRVPITPWEDSPHS